MNQPDGGSAFPTGCGLHQPFDDCGCKAGMSIRDYFAAAALTGYIAAHSGPDCSLPEEIRATSAAYRYADAMLAARDAPSEIVAEASVAEYDPTPWSECARCHAQLMSAYEAENHECEE